MVRLPEYLDTHSHLHRLECGEEWQKIIPQALDAGTWIILVGHDYASSARAVEIAREFPYGVYATVGLHPAFISQAEITPKNFGIDAFQELVNHPKVVGVGEVGFDTRHAEDDLHNAGVIHEQEEVLRQFAALAARTQLPLILHAHNDHDELLRFIAWFREKTDGVHLRGLVHHFTGNSKVASAYRAHGVLPTFTGLMARSHTGNDLIRSVSPEELLIESECPHLVNDPVAAPRPFPAHLPGTVSHVAALRKETPDATRSAVTKNALRLFSKIFRNL